MKIAFIGGTGMLAKAARKIAKEHQLCLISRSPDNLSKKLNATPISMDWSNPSSVNAAIFHLQNTMPEIDLLLSWVHDNGLASIEKFEALLKAGGRSIRIHGSAAGDPAQGIKTDPPAPNGITRQHVVLGSIKTAEEKRWLTHDEISDGVFKAFKDPRQKHLIIGQL